MNASSIHGNEPNEHNSPQFKDHKPISGFEGESHRKVCDRAEIKLLVSLPSLNGVAGMVNSGTRNSIRKFNMVLINNDFDFASLCR